MEIFTEAAKQEQPIYPDVQPQRPRLVLIGAGFVNQAIAKIAAELDFNIYLADVYSNNLTLDTFPPQTRLLLADTFPDVIDKLHIVDEDYVVVDTHNSQNEALECLINPSVKYLSVLASRQKAQEAAICVLSEIVQIRHQIPRRVNTFGELVVIRGAGDIATGVALRLYHAGFRVVMLEMAQPTVIRCSVAFGQALFASEATVEGVKARHAKNVDEIMPLLNAGVIPILVDEMGCLLPSLRPVAVVDAILAKVNKGTHRGMAPVTIALGPGFEAGKDCDAVIETNRGHYLGRVIYQGAAQANTGIPGSINGETIRRVIRAPGAGVVRCCVKLGDLVKEGDTLAYIGDVSVVAPLSGMVRGLINNGLIVTAGFKIGDIDPRGATADFTTVSDKARAIGGAVLEAVMALSNKSVPRCQEVTLCPD